MKVTWEAWALEDKPKQIGWYAVAYCWEAEEGIFPGAAWWNGDVWRPKRPIIMFAGPFGEESAAAKWASEHDPEA